jgi:hypothetical protein
MKGHQLREGQHWLFIQDWIRNSFYSGAFAKGMHEPFNATVDPVRLGLIPA